MFIANAYPAYFFNNLLDHFCNVSENAPMADEITNDDIPIVIFKVPYFGKCSRTFANDITNLISRKFPIKIRIVFSTLKVKSYFVLKCFSPVYLSSNVVYRFNCMSESCTDSYIGYTSRHLYERCDEEHLNFKTKKQSEVKDHVMHCLSCKESKLSFRVFSVLRHCRSETHAKLFEAFCIKRFHPTLNKQLFAQGASKILHIWK